MPPVRTTAWTWLRFYLSFGRSVFIGAGERRRRGGFFRQRRCAFYSNAFFDTQALGLLNDTDPAHVIIIYMTRGFIARPQRLVATMWLIFLPLALTGQADPFLDAMPHGYYLQAYDDCGVPRRQPHVRMMKDNYLWTFQLSDTRAEPKARSAVFGPNQIGATYTNLDPHLSYVLALTYANDHVYHRVQSLEAGPGLVLHGPYPLPRGRATRVLVKVPPGAIREGKLDLTWKREGEANATVSIIELWANAPASNTLRFDSLVGLQDKLVGQLFDVSFNAISNARITFAVSGGDGNLTTKTDGEGIFAFNRRSIESLAAGRMATVSARLNGQEGSVSIATSNLFFEPVRYRPIPAAVTGLAKNVVSLDGAWRINPKPGPNARNTSLNAADWSNFQVPGQWAQQGYDIAKDQTAAMAKEFVIPAKWAGYRIYLRFDAIHSGARYWLNGRLLGYSENLFTPVEWEITDAAKIGETNRLDLAMTVATASERLSHMSDYAGYTLGGIDRAVKIYALPRLQISHLGLNAGLDQAYQNGRLTLGIDIDNPDHATANGLVAGIQLFDARGHAVKHSNQSCALGPIRFGRNTVPVESQVPHPLKWNAEQPNLYKLVVSLKKDGRTLEQIERSVGFRTVEVKDRQLYINGARVKLAGVCHHEIDPLTGRANTMGHEEEDIKLFKSGNINYVRTSHYPCPQEFLEAADRCGLYVESEAPVCWVPPSTEISDIPAVLTSTSAMIDYNECHPSVIIWSLGNESHWSAPFADSDKLCHQLDPTRPTTIEHAFSGEDKVTCDIISRHYQNMPYDQILKEDPRPFLHGECFFLVYHERTDVAIDPGLRELWAAGSADPASAWGKSCIANLNASAGLIPGIYPGAWSYIYRSAHCIGSEIWSGVDDIAFMPNGKIVSSENGNAYWGIIDSWRRPKPELRLSKFVFSPVWFPVRELPYPSGQDLLRVPVENRYSFTDFSQLDFLWELNGKHGKARIRVAPGSNGELVIPVRPGTPAGATLFVRAMNGTNEVVNATLCLGRPAAASRPAPQAGPPQWHDDGHVITIGGHGFSLVLDQATGNFDAANPSHRGPILTFPSLHITRHDFGDLDPKKGHYAEFPDAKTRVVDKVTVAETNNALEITVMDHYQDFAGGIRWVLDQHGVGDISYDYTYTGANLDAREVGIKALLPGECDEVQWRRWSEWGRFPEDCICRTAGRAHAHRAKKWPVQPVNMKPTWPWSQDETELGTADFRSIKFHIYEASLIAPDQTGVQVRANADAHFRCCLAKNGVMMHILSQCPLAPLVLTNGARLTGDFAVRLLGRP